MPSTCGPNAICQVRDDMPACSCLANYIGIPPNCRPECTINPECSSNLACINQHCVNPCIGSCGANALCSVVNHVAVCSCIQGYTGDPFSSCVLFTGKFLNYFSECMEFIACIIDHCTEIGFALKYFTIFLSVYGKKLKRR